MHEDRAVHKNLLRIALAALALAACDVDSESSRDAGPDAVVPFTQVFEIQQPADPGLQQLINSCASGFDQASCDAMCRRVICGFGLPQGLEIYKCSLRRSGPLATITVTFNGPIQCPLPPPIPTDVSP